MFRFWGWNKIENIIQLPKLSIQTIEKYILKISNVPKVRKPSCKHVDGQCDLDLWPTNLNINRLPPLTIRHVCTKIHLDPTFRSYDIVRKQKKYLIFVLFLEVVTLTFDPQTSILIGFLLSPSGMCVPRFI
jgi:hypothetical protein